LFRLSLSLGALGEVFRLSRHPCDRKKMLERLGKQMVAAGAHAGMGLDPISMSSFGWLVAIELYNKW